MHSGCHKARILTQYPEGKIDLCLLTEPADSVLKHIGNNSVLVLDNLHRHREWFRNIPSVVSFDLYDLGIAFFDKQYNKQNYIVNF